ncbi:MAG: hypothetical protein JRJ85_17295, partial [Deltaproteobacteria bacterium]|nr:hypothetical protein [Deltaproteobacteria bacterium]
MISRKTTIVFVPEGASHVKQLNVPAIVIFLPVLLLIACVIFLGWVIPEYKIMKAKIPLLAQLEKEKTEKDRELNLLEKRIHRMNSSIDKLQKLNHSLKLIANTEVKDNEYDSRF